MRFSISSSVCCVCSVFKEQVIDHHVFFFRILSSEGLVLDVFDHLFDGLQLLFNYVPGSPALCSSCPSASPANEGVFP